MINFFYSLAKRWLLISVFILGKSLSAQDLEHDTGSCWSIEGDVEDVCQQTYRETIQTEDMVQEAEVAELFKEQPEQPEKFDDQEQVAKDDDQERIQLFMDLDNQYALAVAEYLNNQKKTAKEAILTQAEQHADKIVQKASEKKSSLYKTQEILAAKLKQQSLSKAESSNQNVKSIIPQQKSPMLGEDLGHETSSCWSLEGDVDDLCQQTYKESIQVVEEESSNDVLQPDFFQRQEETAYSNEDELKWFDFDSEALSSLHAAEHPGIDHSAEADQEVEKDHERKFSEPQTGETVPDIANKRDDVSDIRDAYEENAVDTLIASLKSASESKTNSLEGVSGKAEQIEVVDHAAPQSLSNSLEGARGTAEKIDVVERATSESPSNSIEGASGTAEKIEVVEYSAPASQHETKEQENIQYPASPALLEGCACNAEVIEKPSNTNVLEGSSCNAEVIEEPGNVYALEGSSCNVKIFEESPSLEGATCDVETLDQDCFPAMQRGMHIPLDKKLAGKEPCAPPTEKIGPSCAQRASGCTSNIPPAVPTAEVLPPSLDTVTAEGQLIPTGLPWRENREQPEKIGATYTRRKTAFAQKIGPDQTLPTRAVTITYPGIANIEPFSLESSLAEVQIINSSVPWQRMRAQPEKIGSASASLPPKQSLAMKVGPSGTIPRQEIKSPGIANIPQTMEAVAAESLPSIFEGPGLVRPKETESSIGSLNLNQALANVDAKSQAAQIGVIDRPRKIVPLEAGIDGRVAIAQADSVKGPTKGLVTQQIRPSILTQTPTPQPSAATPQNAMQPSLVTPIDHLQSSELAPAVPGESECLPPFPEEGPIPGSLQTTPVSQPKPVAPAPATPAAPSPRTRGEPTAPSPIAPATVPPTTPTAPGQQPRLAPLPTAPLPQLAPAAPAPAAPTAPAAPITPAPLPPEVPAPANAPENIDNRTILQPNETQPAVNRAPVNANVEANKGFLINFSNVGIIEYIRFISRITGKNFIFDDAELQFNVTIVSEQPTSIENIMAALMQELRIHGLSLIEQGNNLIIHTNAKVNSPGKVIVHGEDKNANVETRVFTLVTLDPTAMVSILKPLLSDQSIVEAMHDTSNLIVTDIAPNIDKVAQLLKSLDSTTGGYEVGQYLVRNTVPDALIALALKIMTPLAQGKQIVLVPHNPTNSIFIVASPTLVRQTMIILTNLDVAQGSTRVLPLEEGGLGGGPGGGAPGEVQGLGGLGALPGQGVPGQPGQPGRPGQPGGPGQTIGPGGIAPGGIAPEGAITPEILTRNPKWTSELPLGHIENTQFYIHKLHYRRGDQIETALQKIAESLQQSGVTNADLITSIRSIQWIESSNSLVFTGTHEAIEKVKELIEEIDTPLREVFIEMLILDTTITESLNYGVDWGTRFGAQNVAGGQAFLPGTSSDFVPSLDQASLTGPVSLSPSLLNRSEGFTIGIIGRHITHCGLSFNSIGALVHALHIDDETNIVLNPKIIVEDNSPAEIFVGISAPFKTQSIANDIGSVLTNNFEYWDVGASIKVTPYLGSDEIVTLDIDQEISSVAGSNGVSSITGQPVSTISTQLTITGGPTILKNNSKTRLHVPNDYFVIMSGMIQDQNTRLREQVPCLGAVPVFGGLFSRKNASDAKRNIMLFIRPHIIDKDDEYDEITKRQQDIYHEKTRKKNSWKYELDETLDFLNIENTVLKEEDCAYGK